MDNSGNSTDAKANVFRKYSRPGLPSTIMTVGGQPCKAHLTLIEYNELSGQTLRQRQPVPWPYKVDYKNDWKIDGDRNETSKDYAANKMLAALSKRQRRQAFLDYTLSWNRNQVM